MWIISPYGRSVWTPGRIQLDSATSSLIVWRCVFCIATVATSTPLATERFACPLLPELYRRRRRRYWQSHARSANRLSLATKSLSLLSGLGRGRFVLGSKFSTSLEWADHLIDELRFGKITMTKSHSSSSFKRVRNNGHL